MTDEEAYVVQAYGGLLEFAMATYEGLIHRKSSSESELKRHKNAIRTSLLEMGTTLLESCKAQLEGQSGRVLHPSWKLNIRVQALLKDLLLNPGTPTAEIVDRYFAEHEKYREQLLK